MIEDVLYTPDEIAQKLKITKGTVYEMIKRGELDAHRIGKNIRISDTQFKIYLSKSKGFENNYNANIIKENDETFANIGPVNIHVNTKLEGRVKVMIRPEYIILSKGTFVSSVRNVLLGVVTKITQNDGVAKIVLDIGIPIVAYITTKSLKEMDIEIGTELYVIFKTLSVKVYK